MPREQSPGNPERILLIGKTPELFFLGAQPPLTLEEAGRLSKMTIDGPDGTEIKVEPVIQEEFSSGQVDLGFSREAFPGLQAVHSFAAKVAGKLGNCSVRSQVQPILDSRYSVAEHVPETF